MATNNLSVLDRYRGCMFGLAVGDALGAPVEFDSLDEIRRRFGASGIAQLVGWRKFPAGFFTDDTQMSLATAIGCIRAGRAADVSTATEAVYRQYLAWLKTQRDPRERRSPGRTCISALESGKIGTLELRLNDSKGCGGVMRTAPAGLAWPPDEALDRGVAFAAITHSHPSGYLSAGALSCIVSHLARGARLDDALDDAARRLVRHDDHQETLHSLSAARGLAARETPVSAAIGELGEGWVGEEALAIAVYCALKFGEDFRSGVIAAVNHSGDSDSTGSIAGAIMGVSLGVDAIPSAWIEQVEDSERIDRIARALHAVFEEGKAVSLDDYPAR